MAEFEVQLKEVAGNVHDLGKLAVPNAILEKPGTLSEEEFQVMKKHTYFTYTILNTIGDSGSFRSGRRSITSGSTAKGTRSI